MTRRQKKWLGVVLAGGVVLALLRPEWRGVVVGYVRNEPFAGGWPARNWFTRLVKAADRPFSSGRSPSAEKEALAALTGMGPAVVPFLTRALREEDAEARARAAEVLGDIGPAANEAIPALKEAASDPDWKVRACAAVALWKVGGQIDPLIAALKDRDLAVRGRAVSVLGAIDPRPRQAVPGLVALLKDPDSDVRETAAGLLTEIDPGASGVAAALVGLLRDPREPVRRQAAVHLGRLAPGAREVIGPLTQALQDPSPDVQERAALSLGLFGPAGNAAVPRLLAMLGPPRGPGYLPSIWPLDPSEQETPGHYPDPDEDLGYIVGPEPVDVLSPIDSEPPGVAPGSLVRARAVVVLSRMGPQVIPALLETLAHNPEASTGAALALARMPPPDVGPALVEALRHRNATMRAGAAMALGNMHEAARPAVEALTRALDDSNRLVRVKAAKALWKVDQQTDLPCRVLGEALWGADSQARAAARETVRIMGPAGVPALIEKVKHSNERRDVNDVLGVDFIQLGDLGAEARGAVPALIDVVKDRTSHLRNEAVRALGHIGPEARTAVPALTDYLRETWAQDGPQRGDTVFAIVALGRIGPDARPAFTDIAAARDSFPAEVDEALWNIDPVWSGLHGTFWAARDHWPLVLLSVTGLVGVAGTWLWYRMQARRRYLRPSPHFPQP
jgi:HEAT repeat protein